MATAPRKTRLKNVVSTALSIAIVAAAMWALSRIFGDVSLDAVMAQIADYPAWVLGVAVLLTAVDFAVLTLFDVTALDYLDEELGYGEVSRVATIGYAIGHTVGFSSVGGGAVRLRLYGRRGLGPLTIGALMGFNAASYWLGVGLVGGLILLGAPPQLAADATVAEASLRLVGAALLVFVVGYSFACSWRKTPLSWRSYELPVPEPRHIGAQIALGATDWLLSGLVFYVLLPEAVRPELMAFLGLFTLAQIGGLITHVPAGLGVFDAVIALGIGTEALPAVAGALIMYRIIYYGLPLIVALGLLVVEYVQARGQAVAAAEAIRTGRDVDVKLTEETAKSGA